jgi:hypothetical protein
MAAIAPPGSITLGQPTGSYNLQALAAIWVRAGGNAAFAPIAAAIAMAESHGDPNATNHNTNGSTDRGLWQINSVHGAQSTTDPLANAKAAVAISQNGKDWSPWVTYTKGTYKQFLSAAQTAAAPLQNDPVTNAVSAATKPLRDTLSGIAQIGQSASDFVDLVTSGQFWLRVLEVLAGVALLVMGLMSLSGRTTTPVSVAKGAARNASKAAVAL